MVTVLVWPRSTVPLEGSMVKPLCCRDVPPSRLNSTVCGTLELQVGLAGQAQLPGSSGTGLEDGRLHLPSQP